jgi:hypothetical protein
MKPYKVHTYTVIDIETGAVLRDDFYYSTVPPARCEAGLIVAGVAAVIGGVSAVYSADRQRYASNMQQDYLLRQQEYNARMLDYQEQQRGLELQALYDKNAYEIQVSQMQEMRYGLMLQQYGMQAELYGTMAELAGQQFALEQEIYDWQLATLDWEAAFKEEQARFIEEKGSLARELFGNETAKLLAKERARMAAAGMQIGTGSPVAVLGKLSEERQFASDIMKFETDIDAWEKRYEGKQLLNQKNKVKFGEYQSGLDYEGVLAQQRYDVGMLGINATEAGGMLQLAKSQTGLLQNTRTRIGQGAVIDLNKYNTSKYYADVLGNMQSDIYGSAARNATVGGYLNTGASIFNSYNNYYTAKNKYGKGDA